MAGNSPGEVDSLSSKALNEFSDYIFSNSIFDVTVSEGIERCEGVTTSIRVEIELDLYSPNGEADSRICLFFNKDLDSSEPAYYIYVVGITDMSSDNGNGVVHKKTINITYVDEKEWVENMLYVIEDEYADSLPPLVEEVMANVQPYWAF